MTWPRNPCPYDGRGSRSAPILLPPGYSLLYGPYFLMEILLPKQHACLPPLIAVHSIGDQLRPVNLQGSRSQRVSCYALFKGWLLLSQPPRCLRSRTTFTLYH